jgi:hypothetical protein
VAADVLVADSAPPEQAVRTPNVTPSTAKAMRRPSRREWGVVMNPRLASPIAAQPELARGDQVCAASSSILNREDLNAR